MSLIGHGDMRTMSEGNGKLYRSIVKVSVDMSGSLTHAFLTIPTWRNDVALIKRIDEIPQFVIDEMLYTNKRWTFVYADINLNVEDARDLVIENWRFKD